MKSRWIIGLLLTCALAVSANAVLNRIAANKARKVQSQTSRVRTRAAQQAPRRN